MNILLWFTVGVALQGLVFVGGYQIGKIVGLRNYLIYLEKKHRMRRLAANRDGTDWDYKPKRDGLDGT